MQQQTTLARRSFIQLTAAVSGALLIPEVFSGPAIAASEKAFVNDYITNVITNQSLASNAAVRILSGMQKLWTTGPTWDTGTVRQPAVLRASMKHCAEVTQHRTNADAKRAFIADRQHQSYAVIEGLGPLAPLFKAGALAVTSITSAPEGIPATTVDDVVPAGAPAGAQTGAGSETSELGDVVKLMNIMRGSFSSGNPSKFTYLYPRPWRMTVDSKVVPTGATDALGWPVYKTDVVVAPQLLRNRSTTPEKDSGYPSGHTNAFYLAALGLAYAVPERFQEIVARASELADLRIVSGMHSPVDVIGGRILSTGLAAAILHDSQNATLKNSATKQAARYFQAKTHTNADTLFAYAHRDGDTHAATKAAVTYRLTYGLPATDAPTPTTVPEGAEVLLETRLPYLSADQRREVLRTTGLHGGLALLDGPEQWGRINLFAAADGYGAFDRAVRVTMNAAQHGFAAADVWRNDIDGIGSLTKLGTGSLTLAGANRYTGGTLVTAGTLVAGGPAALGRGQVRVNGGTLRVTSVARVAGAYHQGVGGTLDLPHGGDVHGGVPNLPRGGGSRPSLIVAGVATLAGALTIRPTGVRAGELLTVLFAAGGVQGRFAKVTVPGHRIKTVYTHNAVMVALLPH